jgi:hypothetical protein
VHYYKLGLIYNAQHLHMSCAASSVNTLSVAH